MRGVLLGPQQLKSTLRAAVDALGIEGPIATVTAGWQERENQEGELDEQLGRKTINLELYQRAEQIFASDKEFATLHRARQDRLRAGQDYYRLRLHHTFDAAFDIERLSAGTELEAAELQLSLETIRKIDENHLARCRTLREEFEHQARPFERPSIARHRKELTRILKGVGILAIAGGHVAVLLNRLRMFGLAELLKGQALVAWSAGAMVTGERVVLFHESPPQGAGIAEVMDEGLGLHRGILPLPNPKLRLKLDDPMRVGWFARRNEPDKCIAFDHGEHVSFEGDRWLAPSGTQWLKPDGTVSKEWVGKA